MESAKVHQDWFYPCHTHPCTDWLSSNAGREIESKRRRPRCNCREIVIELQLTEGKARLSWSHNCLYISTPRNKVDKIYISFCTLKDKCNPYFITLSYKVYHNFVFVRRTTSLQATRLDSMISSQQWIFSLASPFSG